MQLDLNFDEFEDRAGPFMCQPKPKRPPDSGTAALLFEMVKRLRDGRATQRAMTGGRPAKAHAKQLKTLENRIITFILSDLGCIGFHWLESRIAIRVETNMLERGGPGSLSNAAMRLAIYS